MGLVTPPELARQTVLWGVATAYLMAFASIYPQISVWLAFILLCPSRLTFLHQGLYGSTGLLPVDAYLRNALGPDRSAANVSYLDKWNAVPTVRLFIAIQCS